MVLAQAEAAAAGTSCAGVISSGMVVRRRAYHMVVLLRCQLGTQVRELTRCQPAIKDVVCLHDQNAALK